MSDTPPPDLNTEYMPGTSPNPFPPDTPQIDISVYDEPLDPEPEE